MKMDEKFDLIIPVAAKDVDKIGLLISLVITNLNPSRIIIISNVSAKVEITKLPNVEFMDEDKMIPGLTHAAVDSIIETRAPGFRHRSGWYLQQFLKIGYAKICESKYYVVWDADTLPLNKIRFFDDSGRTLFTIKTEHHKPYFETIDRLFDGSVKKRIDDSFIAENMIIERDLMCRMIAEIELSGDFFWEKILNAVNPIHLRRSGFSEFETFGNWVITHAPESYGLRKLRCLRNCGRYYNVSWLEDPQVIEWMAQDFDTVSFEKWHRKRPRIILRALALFFASVRTVPFAKTMKILSWQVTFRKMLKRMVKKMCVEQEPVMRLKI